MPPSRIRHARHRRVRAVRHHRPGTRRRAGAFTAGFTDPDPHQSGETTDFGGGFGRDVGQVPFWGRRWDFGMAGPMGRVWGI